MRNSPDDMIALGLTNDEVSMLLVPVGEYPKQRQGFAMQVSMVISKLDSLVDEANKKYIAEFEKTKKGLFDDSTKEPMGSETPSNGEVLS